MAPWGARVRSVTIVVAMEQEVMPLVKHFKLQRLPETTFLAGSPMVAWAGDCHGLRLHVVWCGKDARFGGVNNVATTAAAVATYAAVQAFGAPGLLISAGTAGGFASAGAAVGDVYLSTKSVFHARRIPDASRDDALEEYGFGHFRSPPLSALAAACGLKLGVVSTSDSLDCTPTDLALMRAEGAAVKEMEAAAVAWVCEQLRVPFVALKSITDIVDGPHPTRSEFEEHLEVASAKLQRKVHALLMSVAGTPLAKWAVTGQTSNVAGESDTEPASQARGAAKGRATGSAGTLALASSAAPARWRWGDAPWVAAVLGSALGFGVGLGLALQRRGRPV